MKGSFVALLAAAVIGSATASAQPAPTGAAKAPAAPSTVPAGPATAATVSPVASARVIMLRLYVAELARAEKFYHEVFGTTVLQRMGDKVLIMNFPGGVLPGIIMIQSSEEATMNGSFVMQVPDVQAILARAAANGGTLKNTRFEQQVGGMPARSSHFTDPDGNLIEVLQIGAQPK